ncbi:MAG: RNA-binding cell elongation regulator Jag/EloR [Chloroflexota bacterium]
MESLEVSAKTVEDAIKLALVQLGKTRDEVLISVLSEGSRGILGIGGEEARILVTPIGEEEEEPSDEESEEIDAEDLLALGTEVLEEMLERMHIKAQVEVRPTVPDADGQSASAVLDIEGDDLGILIGRRGETLTSLQFITNLIISRRLHRFARLGVDVESYRLRREESLRGMALRMAERVQATHQSITLEAMPAYERRIIHMTLNDSPHVSTQSIGEDTERKVVIMPKR